MTLPELARKIAKTFNIGELKSLCYDLEIEHEELPAGTRSNIARELVEYCKRHSKLEELIRQCDKLRPKESWHFDESWYLDESIPNQFLNSNNSQLNRLWILGLVIATSLIIGLIIFAPSLFELDNEDAPTEIASAVVTPPLSPTEQPTNSSTSISTQTIDESLTPPDTPILPNFTPASPLETQVIPTVSITFNLSDITPSPTFTASLALSNTIASPESSAQNLTKRIVFSAERNGNEDIYIIYADGSSEVRLTDNPARDTCPAWSPNGEVIAFQSHRDGNGEVFLMNPDGSNLVNISNHSADESCPTWSPDGTNTNCLMRGHKRIGETSDSQTNPIPAS